MEALKRYGYKQCTPQIYAHQEAVDGLMASIETCLRSSRSSGQWLMRESFIHFLTLGSEHGSCCATLFGGRWSSSLHFIHLDHCFLDRFVLLGYLISTPPPVGGNQGREVEDKGWGSRWYTGISDIEESDNLPTLSSSWGFSEEVGIIKVCSRTV